MVSASRIAASKRPFIREVRRSRSFRKPDPIWESPSSPQVGSAEGLLVLVRHGESEFNKEDRFTGLKNPDLTPRGIQEAISAGRSLFELQFCCDVAFTSKLKRAQQSLRLTLKELHAGSVPIFEEAALNERDYGELAGLTRDAARGRWGAEQVHLWRRSYDIPPPGGESLEMTARRTLPFYEGRIRPLLTAGKRVLVVAHGNSLRSIVMSLEQFTPTQIVNISFATGTILIYRLNASGVVVERMEIPVGG